MIPKQQLVIERATQLFMQEQARYPGLGETTPELSELKEAGFLDKAKMELMSNEYERPDPKMVEEVFREMDSEKTETLNAEKIEALAKQQKENTDKIMARLEAIPDLDDMIKAMQKSKIFEPLGTALKPLSETHNTHHAKPQQAEPDVELIPGQGWVNKNDPRYKQEITQPQPEQPKQPEPKTEPLKQCANCGRYTLKPMDITCSFCGAPVEPKKPLFRIPDWIKPPHQIHALDVFAGIMVTIIWIAASAWMFTTFGFSWGLVIGFACFWLVFVVVFRLVIGGILD